MNLPRPDKEQDRMIHVSVNNANIEPVFFTYPAVKEIDDIVNKIVKKEKPEYDFIAEDGFGHHFWVIKNKKQTNRLKSFLLKRFLILMLLTDITELLLLHLLERRNGKIIRIIKEQRNIIFSLQFIFLIIS